MEINNTSVDVKVDLSESANQVISNTLVRPAKALGNTGGIILDFFNNTILYPMQRYNIKINSKLEKYKLELEKGIKEIPEDKLVEPKVNILGPAFEALKYNMDEEELKNMFTNLILSSANLDYKDRVLPAYVEIIRQLSSNDAIFLKHFKDYNISAFRSIILNEITEGDNGHKKMDKYILLAPNLSYYSNKNIKLDNLIIDNLIRLNIIELTYTEWYTQNMDIYDKIFNDISHNIVLKQSQKLSYDKGILRLTDFGLNFINICLF